MRIVSTPWIVLLAALALGATAATGCRQPPPAPEGLDESMRFLLREFHADDLTVGAGLTGLMNWYDEEGVEMLELAQGEGATVDNADSFELADLDHGDVDHLPLAEEPDLSRAEGVSLLAMLDCHWAEAEHYMVRLDQEVVFEGDFKTFDRTYTTSREAFEDATATGQFDPVDEYQGVYEDGYDGGDVERSLLLSDNDISVDFLGIDMAYTQDVHFRHGAFDVQGEPRNVLTIFAYLPASATGADGVNSLLQTYSISVLMDWGDDRTLRAYGLWSELDTPWLENDSAAMAATKVNAGVDAAQRISDLCAGVVAIPEEP